MMTEEKVISKVAELMETLDQVKKYNAFMRSLKDFVLIVGGSIAAFLVLLTLFQIFDLDLNVNSSLFFAVAFLTLFIPVAGLLIGVLFVRKQLNMTQVGEWKEELSQGFSSALKILAEIDWDKTLDEIARGRLGYAIYGLVKAAAYLVITVFAFEFLWNGITILFLHQVIVFGIILVGLFAIMFVFMVLRSDLFNRYRELGKLDMLVSELRWFSLEFSRAEFQT
ncbi:MAG: hypothetical protein ABSF44_10210 [Candidatus Bathyarchaeia archaeon]|jgi:hypothetical protein